MNTPILWLDLETRSQVDLIQHGLARYAQDPSTEVVCMSYAFNDAQVKTWFAEDGDPFPKPVVEYIKAGGILYAQNAAFERYLFDFVISNDYDFTPPKLEQWRCSAARALAHGLPKNLADICRALDLPLQKQKEGTRLIREYCAPGFLTEWKPGDRQLMQDYCEMDVMTMRQFCSCLRELDDSEWEQYHITERMNDRGVPLDVPLAEACMDYAADVKADVDDRIKAHTGGAVSSARARKTRDAWLLPKLTEDQVKLLEVKKKGETKISFDAEHRGYLLAAEGVDPEAYRFIELLEEAGGSAVSKYTAMTNTHVDGRAHGSLIWNGAGQTGRYSSQGLQFQNFRSDVFKDPEPVIEDIIEGYEIDSPSETLGRLVRSAITSTEGLTFSDYSQIEARVLPWLAACPEGEKTLDVFREGRDIYTENACSMFHVKPSDVEEDPELRQSAKQGVLACGFEGGAKAVQAMAKGYGITFSHDEANNIKLLWRAANAWAEPLWHDTGAAAKKAVKFPRTEIICRRLSFYFDGYWLWVRLPSGRCLAYADPKMEMVTMPWGDEGLALTCLWGGGTPKAGEKWPRRSLYGGLIIQNCTQGTAADIMRETIVRSHKAGLKNLFTVHDELVVEGLVFDKLHDVMTTPPAWAEGLPIEADTQESKRYGK